MKNKIPFVILASIAILVLVALWTRNSASPSGTPVFAHSGMTSGRMMGEGMMYDFGSISMGKGKVSHDFEMTNDTGKDMRIMRAMTSCMCTETFVGVERGDMMGPFGMAGHGFIPPIDKTVKAGEKVVVRVVFDPAAHGPAGIGRVSRTVTIDTDQGRKVVVFNAVVTP